MFFLALSARPLFTIAVRLLPNEKAQLSFCRWILEVLLPPRCPRVRASFIHVPCVCRTLRPYVDPVLDCEAPLDISGEARDVMEGVLEEGCECEVCSGSPNTNGVLAKQSKQGT